MRSTSNAADDNEDKEIIDIDAPEPAVQEGGFLEEADTYDDSFEVDEEEKYYAKRLCEKIKAAWFAGEDSVDVEEFDIRLNESDDLLKLYASLVNDNPDYFFLEDDLRVEYYLKTNEIVTLNFVYSVEDKSTRMKMIQEYNEAIEYFKKGVNPTWTDMEKFVYIHDYLVRNCEYDVAKTMEHRYDTYGVLVEKKAVCQGYALAVNALANKLGLESHYVSSEEMNHGWNMVKINGKYYMMDVTWDDPTPDRLGRVDHYYMFKSMSFFNTDEGAHMADDIIVEGGVLPEEANDTKYDSYSFFNDIKIGFEYIDGKWYGLYSKDIAIHSLTCDGTDWKVDDVLIDLYDARWYDENGGYFLADLGGGYTSYDNILYYSDNESIYAYDPKDKNTQKVYELSEDEKKLGNICGLYKTDGNRLQYLLTKNLDIEDGIIKAIDIPEGDIDNGKPTAIISVGGIINHGLNAPGNVVYTNQSECKLTGIDDTGIHCMSYFVAEREYSEDELKLVDESSWTTQEGKQIIFDIANGEEGEYYVYGRAMDTSRNTSFASLGKVVIDKTAPIVYFIGKDVEKEDEARIYVYDDYFDKVYVNGQECEPDDGIVTITSSDEPYEIKVIDKAGNETVETINYQK
ncbi:MAG: hypothetical protein IKS48_12690 [Eubacterium sp.]|nr:hypothetical protein [Eubacterium sp.]